MKTAEQPLSKGSVCHALLGGRQCKVRIVGPSVTKGDAWICEDFETGSWFVLAQDRLTSVHFDHHELPSSTP